MNYILVHGAGSDAWYWHLVTSELRRHGQEVIAVDLPCADDAADLPDYADVVVRAVGETRPLILVAQSMAGLVAPLVCERVPVALVVLVNAMIPAEGETAGGWWSATGQAQARRALDLRQGRDPDAAFDVYATFLHDVPASVAQESGAHVRRQSDTPFRSSLRLPGWPAVATRVVAGRDDRFFPLDFQQRLARDRLGLTADVLPGGHLIALSQPLTLAAQLETYRRALDA
ncbi:MAG: alpha/beta hydrolase [Chloroflexi bacterium]|nr:alpha/beta hydrolase [Chloroflexota bacterium]